MKGRNEVYHINWHPWPAQSNIPKGHSIDSKECSTTQKACSCHSTKTMDSLSRESAREMERLPVTAATGALGPVLVKLAALLGAEYKLQERTRRDIISIKSELEPVHDLLGKLWGRLDLDVACKDWMTEARELSYDMEDDIHSFTLGLEIMGDGSFIQRGDTDGPFKEFMGRVKDVSKRCGKMQKIGDTICNRSKLTTDPRALFLHRDSSELVGMEEKKERVMELLQEHQMVCIVGSAGMGKTTLADLVYHAVGDEFQCRAFVSVHPSPNMTEILGTILSQVTDGAMSAGCGNEPAARQNIVNDISISLSEKSGTEPAAEQNDFIKAISTFLSNKRYMVIIDDIWHWEEWEVIRKALPKNNLGCKLIITTRVWNIAQNCSSEQGAGVYRQYFDRADAARLSAMRLSKSVEGTNNAKELSAKIADMCGVPPVDICPLAVICLSSAWAESRLDDKEWDAWASHVLDEGFMSTPSLKPLVQSLCLGFDDLPAQLRTCLLYCTVYPPEYYGIDRGCLMRKWIAEGFVSQVEVAETYLEDLVSRNVLQWDMGMYTVHPIMRAFLVCKAKEDNFIAYNGPSNSSHAKQICRLSLSMNRYPDEDVLSHTRSLVVSGQCQLAGVPFKVFKKLRLLEIHDSSRPENGHLVDICGLIRLKYLGLDNCDQITELPREIGRLQNLETLYVAGTRISDYGLPTEIGKLQHLGTLDVSRTWVTELPTWIEKLPSLKTLNISHTSITELPTWIEIEKLQSLKTLNISHTYITELPTWIEKLQYLQTLDISVTEVTELPTWIEKLQSLKTLHIGCTNITELPTWIGKLQSLKTLNVSGTEVTELPREIRNLEHLETLDISQTRVSELPKEIGKLSHLRTLDISGTKVRELSCFKDQSPLLSVIVDNSSGHLVEKLPLGVISSRGGEEVISSSEAKSRDDLSILVLFNHFGQRCEVLPVRMVRVAGRHMKVPQWVKHDLCNVCSLDIRLCKLVHQDLEFLKTKMPNLQALQLRFEVLQQEPVAITGGGFWKLETFYVDSRLPRVVTFKPRAMPKLKHLEFKFYTGAASQDYSMGIKNLDSLEKVVFRCSEYYTSHGPGIHETIVAIRKEAAEHPNEEVTLWVNDMCPEVFCRGASWKSLAVKAIVEKEFEEWKKETENRRREIKGKAEHICEQRHRLLTAVERRAELEKNNAVIEKEIQDQFSYLERKYIIQQETEEREKETWNTKREIEERAEHIHDEKLRLLTLAERRAQQEKSKEIQKTISILEKSFAKNKKRIILEETTIEARVAELRRRGRNDYES